MTKGRQVYQTTLSKLGHCFLGPALERYRNLGRVIFTGTNDSCQKAAFGFHVAEGIDQPLAAVASSNDANNMVVLDSNAQHKGSKIIRADSEIGKAIRKLVQQANGTTINQVKNTYSFRLWLDEPQDGGANNQGFPRPGPK